MEERNFHGRVRGSGRGRVEWITRALIARGRRLQLCRRGCLRKSGGSIRAEIDGFRGPRTAVTESRLCNVMEEGMIISEFSNRE